ncbi:hypothetical protein [Aliivibrio sifiae]|uniref:Porin domain-containing protein n=1 Tax=Aliivibrio sifiae TaxID=566293 RepID=A0A2S7X1Q4_9GAMM|nr:hypothetical protein [Aliivibrio sifiae]PQJ83581.1 hypothetical protein BTO23_20805 [Aliivibrio sifiae]GLR76780.1 hypothetical protein GCM10007855_36550 [Aliivibrio sifiae]
MWPDIAKIISVFSLVYGFNVHAMNLHGFLGIDVIDFVNTENTMDEAFSVVGELRSRGELSENLNYNLRLYGQKGINEYTEGYFDPTIAKINWIGDSYQIDVGYDLIYWGVTEGINVINIINQRDQIRDYFQKQGLGQSMVAVSYFEDSVTVDGYILPRFEELNYGGTQRPWGLGLPVDASQSTYESSKGKNHTDYAARISGMLDDLEFGFVYFNGTYRQPIYKVDGEIENLAPHYVLGNTFGLDAQYIMDSNIYKFELGYFKPNSYDSYVSTTFGVERTLGSSWFGEGESTVYAEYYYDSRQDDNTVAFQNDIFLAYKYTTYNVYDLETTIGGIIDTQYGGVIGTLEITGKLTNNIKVSVELIYFNSSDPNDALFYSNDFDQLSFNAHWYF